MPRHTRDARSTFAINLISGSVSHPPGFVLSMVVIVMPWKLVSTLFPCTSSEMRRNFLKDCSSFCRSASDTSNTRPFNPSLANSAQRMGVAWMYAAQETHYSLFPCVLVTNVLPIFLTANTAGAFTSYQSFLVNGSILLEQWESI